MTTFYCDHGYTGYPSAFMSVPASAASLPQEGDGLASGTGAAPTVASASMDFSASTAAAGATFAVHGATLTCVASGANTTQFNAGSGSTLATNLATAINATTSVPTTATGGVSPYLKGLVWAVASGSVLTVHTRIASAALNQSSNASATLVCGTLGNWTSAPSTANFTGGVSGPWATFFNTAALTAGPNASILAPGTYGAWTATIMGTPAGGDIINVRTGRANADITLTLSSSTATTSVGRTAGSAGNYVKWVFDNGVVWSDGQSNGVFTVLKNAGSVNATFRALGYTWIAGKMKTGTDVISGGTPNVKFSYTFSDPSGYTFGLEFSTNYGTRHTVVECVETYDSAAGAYSGAGNVQLQQGAVPANPYQPVVYRNCKLGHMTRLGAKLVEYNTYGVAADFVDCLLAYGSLTTYSQSVVSITAGQSAAAAIRMFRPKFTGGGGGHHTLVKLASTSTIAPVMLYIEDPVSLGQFIPSDSVASLCGAWAGVAGTALSAADTGMSQMVVNGNGKREFLVDTPRYLYEWRDAGFPTSGLSTLPDGSLFSIRFSVVPTAVASGLVLANAPQRGPRQVVTNTLGDGTFNLTMRFLLDTLYGGSTYSAIDSEWWIEGAYVSSVDGSVVRFTTEGSGSAVSTDTQTWSSLSYTPFAAGSRSYNRHKIIKSLANVKANCDVSLRLMCGKQPSTLNEWCIIDPSPILS